MFTQKVLKVCITIASFVLIGFNSLAQTPINMAAQPNFTYKETFADINNWTFNTSPTNGVFTAGIGATAWKGNDINSTGSIPSAPRITVATTSFQTAGNPNQGSSSGLYRGTQNINIISTGTTDNSSSIAIDFFMDFTGVNAGTLSFDWASLNNSSGNRAGSLRVYASTDGTSFTEISAAAVLNFVNNTATNGSISFVTLPSSFNNNANARLRFYYHNGVGGTTGSRPRISLDNVQVTATPTTVCTTPTAQPTSFVANTVAFSSIQASFTAAANTQGYLVIMSQSSSLSISPLNNKNYAVGDNIGDATIVATGAATNFTVTNLNNTTPYYFFIFSMNNLCSGGPLYLLQNPLTATITTLSNSAPCTIPTAQPSNLTFSNISAFTVFGTYSTAVNATDYLVVRSTTATLSANPINGTTYSVGNTIGNGTVVAFTPTNSFTAINLQSGIQYYFFVFAVNNQNCTGGPQYLTSNPLTNTVTTTIVPVCASPINQPTNLQLSADSKGISGFFTRATNTDNYLVLISTSNTLSQNPQNNINYTIGNSIGNATVLSIGTNTGFIANNLTIGTTYYFYIFGYNNICTGGTKYNTTNALQGNSSTTLNATSNVYYGNLHAHSSYSDGNKDNPTFTPANNYAFAKNSLCMDFLGISEHNHSDAGMNINNWQPAIAQAVAATTSTFVGLYGMEWGVISGGGHVLVYGTNQLLGWEINNYNLFVPKNSYVGTVASSGNNGLFATINSFGTNAVALLAHPNNSDYDNLSNISFNLVADSAVVGSALANGPSTSTNISYTNPGSSLAYYDYFKKLLAKGYHIAPSIDHDNHNTTFGRTAYTRTAIVASTLNATSILDALKARRFYATEDCDTRLTFRLNNQQMGSIISGSTLPALSVYIIDPTNLTAIPNIKVMYGLPNSGVLATAIDSINGNTLNFTDYNLPNTTTAYYFVEATIDGNKIISAPIWYTYNNGSTLPINLSSFSAKLIAEKQVSIEFTTELEINNRLFIIEKSIDGVYFKTLDSIAGKMNSNQKNYYTLIDKNPYNGINYYRLIQIDADGKQTISKVISINTNTPTINYFSIVSNPVNSSLKLNINSQKNQLATIIVTDIRGKIILQVSTNLLRGNQQQTININNLPNSTYTASIIGDGWQQSKLFLKQ